MDNIITISEARAREWDMIIAGSSFAAMFLGHGLPENMNILFIEKGGMLPHASQVANGWPERERFNQRNLSRHEKRWVAYSMFGGNSNFWWGDSPRLHPDDFELKSRFGVGVDWPIGYDEMEPWWTAVEEIMEIAGGGNEHILPRNAPFPYPAHRPSRSDVALQSSSDLWTALPNARSNGGSRPRCCVNGVCGICPIDSKFTILNGLDRLRHPNARFLLDTEVRALDIAGGGLRGVQVSSTGGEEAVISGNAVALGTNAIFNAAILLRSGLDRDREALGRYLHEQAPRDVYVDTESLSNFYGGTSETGHGYHFYHDIDRARAAAVLIENVIAPPKIRPEPGRWANRLHLRLVAEDLPQPQNRVILDRNEPVIEWTGHDDYAFRGLERALDGLADIIPDRIEDISVGGLNPSEAHIQGTHRMGSDPEGSVVDDRMRVHGFDNLLALGSGAFPTCSPANCSLTIAALSLRAAEVFR